MFARILVPLDGSELAESALPYAEALARSGGGQLVLARAAIARTFPGVDATEAEIRVVEEAEAYLAGKAERLRRDGFTVETGVPYGDAVEETLTEIRLRKADVVVMATHGRSGLGRWVYGSVAEGVLASSPVPVLLVRAWHAGSVWPMDKRLRLLVPLDASLFAQDALPVADELARALGSQAVLLQAIPSPDLASGDGVQWTGADLQSYEAARLEAEENLRQAAARLTLPPEDITREVRVGDAAEAIAAGCREHGVGLVVMASHRRTGLSRLLLGSVADAVLRRGEVPLLLIRSAEEPGILKELVHAESAEGPAGSRVSVALTQDEIALIRSALGTLGQTVSRHEHLHARIQTLLSRLPSGQEVDSREVAPSSGGAP
jgi:nucleotide-binding universal stress UspA family protein